MVYSFKLLVFVGNFSSHEVHLSYNQGLTSKLNKVGTGENVGEEVGRINKVELLQTDTARSSKPTTASLWRVLLPKH